MSDEISTEGVPRTFPLNDGGWLVTWEVPAGKLHVEYDADDDVTMLFEAADGTRHAATVRASRSALPVLPAEPTDVMIENVRAGWFPTAAADYQQAHVRSALRSALALVALAAGVSGNPEAGA